MKKMYYYLKQKIVHLFMYVLRKEAELMGDVRRTGFVNSEKCVEEGAGEDETDI